jgi:hypothetical protein
MVKQMQSKTILLVLACTALVSLMRCYTLLNEKAALNESSLPVFLDLPLFVKDIVINMGSNLDPMMPA